MPSIDIDVPSEWDIYRISYLVHKGWKRNPDPYSSYSFKDIGKQQIWHHIGFINRDAGWGLRSVLITRGKKKGEYKEEEGRIDIPYFTLDEAWKAQMEVEKV